MYCGLVFEVVCGDFRVVCGGSGTFRPESISSARRFAPGPFAPGRFALGRFAPTRRFAPKLQGREGGCQCRNVCTLLYFGSIR